MATALWVTLAVVTCVQLCRAAVVFTGNDNAIVLNWAGPDPAAGWTFLARVSFDSPTAAGKYYTVFSNWDYAAPTGAAGGTGVPTCTNTGGLWYGYAVSDTSLWSYAYQVNKPSVCANTGNSGSSGFVTLATKTEVGIGIEFNGTSQDSLMRAYVLNSNVFGTTGVQYSLPTTNKKTYLFANTPGTIRDIAFIQGDIGFSLISQYTRGTTAVSASTPNLLLWYSLSDFIPAGQTISPTAGSLNVQLSFLSSSTILSAPQTNCGGASFLTSGTGCVVGNNTIKNVNPDGSFTASVEALALLPDTTLFLGLRDKITADGAIQLAGALELNVTDDLTGDFVANLLVSDASGLYGTFNSITVRPPTGSACKYDTRPAYSPAAFSVTISPSGCGTSSSSKKGVIIGAVIGGVVGLVIIVVVIGLVLVYKFPFIAAKFGYRSALQRGSVMGGRRDRDVMTL